MESSPETNSKATQDLSSDVQKVTEFLRMNIKVANPDQQPKLFAAQVKMARYLVALQEKEDGRTASV
jgi:hypothetical protein